VFFEGRRGDAMDGEELSLYPNGEGAALEMLVVKSDIDSVRPLRRYAIVHHVFTLSHANHNTQRG
jgi:hypothetical protein